MSEWTAEQWLQWRRDNIKLFQDGWTLETQFMLDGSIREFAKKDGEIIDIMPDPWK